MTALVTPKTPSENEETYKGPTTHYYYTRQHGKRYRALVYGMQRKHPDAVQVALAIKVLAEELANDQNEVV